MDSKDYYNHRYQAGYRAELAGYEKARYEALKHLIKKTINQRDVTNVLDYGAGNGLFVNLWEEVFPQAEISFADVSDIALNQLCIRHPEYIDRLHLINNNTIDVENSKFDIILSVEVMEHVEDLGAYLHEIFRLLKKNGWFIWTTPCANSLSVEHVYNVVFNQIERTNDGYRRWKWEDPGHLRRLKSDEIKEILLKMGYCYVGFRFRAHLFSFLVEKFKKYNLISAGLGDRLMQLDYKLFRLFSNGASMIGYARK